MLGAILIVHLPNGFWMNWTGGQKGEGFEFHLLMIGTLSATVMAGPGGFAIARALSLPSLLE